MKFGRRAPAAEHDPDAHPDEYVSVRAFTAIGDQDRVEFGARFHHNWIRPAPTTGPPSGTAPAGPGSSTT